MTYKYRLYKTQYRELVRKSRGAGRWPVERALGISTTFLFKEN